MNTKHKIYLAEESDTLSLGKRLARRLWPGCAMYLRGELGVGKTTLVRGVLRGLGFQDKVKSPSFTLVESYVISGLNVYHLDLYRFTDPGELEELGFREYFNTQSLCIVEWPQKAHGLLPVADIEVHLSIADGGRNAEIEAYSAAGEVCLRRLPER
ncbi:MAG: tRNA (adenosine(37)-N6)-threonylcarbamoyltransferase complex ATPase subunit type 1 TsaE [Burkholderiales bacterium]